MSVTANCINVHDGGLLGCNGTKFVSSLVAQHGFLVGGTSDSVINSLAGAANGELPIGLTGSDPVLATITAGSGINIINSPGGIQIISNGYPLLTWSVLTSNAVATFFHGYIVNSSSRITVTLPSATFVRTRVRICGLGTGGWTIVPAANALINVGSVQSSVGSSGGSISSTNQNDAIELLWVQPLIWDTLKIVGNVVVT